MKIFKAFLLHFYQPKRQTKFWVDKITCKCYRPIFNFLRKWTRGFVLTANINYSLLELLEKFGHHDVLDDIKYCVDNHIIELVYSTYCHPIIPLIPEDFVKLQIFEDIKRKAKMGLKVNCGGFFFPEMAFNKESLNYLQKEMPFINWTVVEDVSVLSDQVPFSYIPSYKGFLLFLRSSQWSRYLWDEHIDFNEFSSRLKYQFPQWTKGADGYLIPAMDAETFGAHVPGFCESFLFPMIESWGRDGTLCSFEELKKLFPSREVGTLMPSSWATNQDHLRINKPFPLWDDRDNPHHADLWKLVNATTQSLTRIHRNKEDLREYLDLHTSCNWWWLTYGHWDPTFAQGGAMRAYKLLCQYSNGKEIEDVEASFKRIMSLK